MKITPIYKNSIVLIPYDVVSQRLSTVSAEELKVLLLAIGEQSFTLSEKAAQLHISEEQFRSILEMWQEAGALSFEDDEKRASYKKPRKPRTSKKNGQAPSAEQTEGEEKPQKTRKSRKQSVEVHTVMPHYTTTEVAGVVERRGDCSELLDSCQQMLGKIFNATEISIIIGLVDHLSLPTDYVLLLCSHACNVEKKSVRYIEKMALYFYDNDVLTYKELEGELLEIESKRSNEYFVRNLFGMGKRALIKKEKDFIGTWFNTYGFSREMVEKAYTLTVQRTKEPSLSYANAILGSWYSAGYKTLAEVEQNEGDGKSKPKVNDNSSFSTDDYFEAALKRSYGDSSQ